MSAGFPEPTDQPTAKRMVLVTGAGRSGTSTVAGTLHYLGFLVPEPVMQGNESNPRGFFESWWPVRFHKRIMKRAGIEQTDSRPEAFDLVQAAITDEDRARLHDWLGEVTAISDRVVVKDPRAVWAPALWVGTAAEMDIEISFLTMLRHPAEVIGSRKANYANWRPGMDDWDYAIWNLCGWITSNLHVERHTRGQRRSFVRYTDLLADWRAAMRLVRDDQGLELDSDLDPGTPHAVDDFIDVDLRRHVPSWSGWDLPTDLVELADGTFAALSRLADLGGHDPGVEAELDEIAERYTQLYKLSRAVAYDAATARAAEAKATGVAEVRAELNEARQRKPSALRSAGKRVLDRYPSARRARDRLRRG
jgi:hypothetical protein